MAGFVSHEGSSHIQSVAGDRQGDVPGGHVERQRRVVQPDLLYISRHFPRAYVGYRLLEIDFDEVDDAEFDDEFHLGIRFNLN